MPTISPCLWLDDQAEEAAAFYTDLLPDSSITGTSHYPERFDNPSEKPRGSVMTVEFELASVPFTALNGGPGFTPNPSISFILNFDPSRDPQAHDTLEATWEALSESGSPLMPLDEYPFSELYGWVQDRFGVSWQLILTDPEGEDRPFLVPSLMFVGDVVGRAEEAMDVYTSVFENARRGATVRYPDGMEPEQEGTIMFADFTLDDQWFACMDSAQAHDFAFDEGVSLQILCTDQDEVDRYWDALTAEGGE
ncbi:MAG: VOC family protein, partial [Halobacteriales archaeon]|nr:VOC family protein [Halobacteriales archaeon]